MIKIIEADFDKKLWNKLAPHPLQSWEWGEARASMRIEVVRFGEFDEDKLKNVFQLTLHNLKFGYKIGYLPRSVAPSKELLDYLYTYGRKTNLIFIKLEPYVPSSEFKIQNSKLKISSHPLFPEWTLMLDLTRSEEDLMKKMKSKTRYNIRLAQKRDVTVKEMTTSEGFEIFQKLYFITANRQNYFGHNYNYHKAVFETLKANISHLLIAFYKDMPLAAYEVFTFNDILYYTYGGSSHEKRNLMASHLLMWETIKFGKQHKLNKFDMWNSLAPDYDESHPWAGFTRFKEGFGAEFVHLTKSHDLVMNKSLYRLYNGVYKLREWKLGTRV